MHLTVFRTLLVQFISIVDVHIEFQPMWQSEKLFENLNFGDKKIFSCKLGCGRIESIVKTKAIPILINRNFSHSNNPLHYCTDILLLFLRRQLPQDYYGYTLTFDW